MAVEPVFISIAGLTALTWVFTVVALAFTAGRFVVRNASSAKYIVSDYINALAALFLAAYMATYTHFFDLYYAVTFYAAGAGPPVSNDDLISYFKTEAAVSMMFWVIIYLVKASFLMLYYSLFRVSSRFMMAWWAVTGLTLLSFLASFIAVLWLCGPDPAQNLWKPESCLSPAAIVASVNVVKMQFALNLVTDILIIGLPIFMLGTLQMRLIHKIGLALIFAIALVDVAFDILRTVYTLNGGAIAIDTIWDILEPAIAVMVCAMPTYRNAFGIRRRSKHSGDKSTYTLHKSSRPLNKQYGPYGGNASGAYSSQHDGTSVGYEESDSHRDLP